MQLCPQVLVARSENCPPARGRYTGAMGPAALVVAVLAALSLLWPAWGMYLAMALAGLAMCVGLGAMRRSDLPGSRRLCGAGAVTLGGLIALIAIAEYLLAHAAISAVSDLL